MSDEKDKSQEAMDHLRKIMEGLAGLAGIIGEGVTTMFNKVVEQVVEQKKAASGQCQEPPKDEGEKEKPKEE